MRILVLSDLLLPTERSKKPKVFYEEQSIGLNFEFYESIRKSFFPLTAFTELINHSQPDLVLIAGDMFTDEKENQSVSFNALLSFLNYINSNEIQCFIIQDNHDIYSYDKLLKKIKTMEYIEDITDKMIEWRGKKFLGISHAFTYSLKNCRNIKSIYPDKIDFVLGHVLNQRRIWLFDLDTKFIFTGHSDISITMIENRFLISTDLSPLFYFILDYKEQTCVMEYHCFFCVSVNRYSY